MLEITQSAVKELEAYFTDKEKSDIRIYLAPGGCSGPRLSLGLDEAGDDDEVFEEGGFKFCINKDLMAEAGAVRIDMTSMGFTIESGKPLAGGGGGCGGCGGGCSSH